jgi:hypothetical protein
MSPVIVVALTALVLIAMERRMPSIPQPRVPGWAARAAALNSVQVAVVYVGAFTWDRWLPQLRLWNGEVYGSTAAIILGYVAITFVVRLLLVASRSPRDSRAMALVSTGA